MTTPMRLSRGGWPEWAHNRVRDAWMQGRIKARIWCAKWPALPEGVQGLPRAVANLPTAHMIAQALRADAGLWQDVAAGHEMARAQIRLSARTTLCRILDWGVNSGGYSLRVGETVCDLCPLTQERWTGRPRNTGCTQSYREDYLMRLYHESNGVETAEAYRVRVADREAEQLRTVAERIEEEYGLCGGSEKSSG